MTILSLAQQQQDQVAQLAALKATGIALFDVTFSCEITAGDDLSLVTWRWNIGWANGSGRLYPPESLVPTDGSSMKWGGIAPGASWREQITVTLTNPTVSAAEIILIGCTAGAITRTIDSAPRFGLRSQALDG